MEDIVRGDVNIYKAKKVREKYKRMNIIKKYRKKSKKYVEVMQRNI